MTLASGQHIRRGRDWIQQRPWLAGVAAVAAIIGGWVSLSMLAGRATPAPHEAVDPTPRPFEIPVGFPAPSRADRAYYAKTASPPETTDIDRHGIRWSFAQGLPDRWQPTPSDDARQPKLYRTTQGLAVETTPTPSAYQLVTNAHRLDSGRYAIIARASVVRGGMQLGVLDPDANVWLSTRFFWSGQPRATGADLVVPFSLARPTRVQVVLANWVRRPRRSLWEISEVKLGLRVATSPLTKRDRAYLEERAAPVPKPMLSSTDRWNLCVRLPNGWSASADTLTRASGDAMTVETGSGRSAYQILSKRLALPTGRYELIVHGEITDGGLQLGVLDVERNAWLATSTFWEGQRPSHGFVLPFVLSRSRRAQLVLANWSPRNRSSTWELTRIELRSEAP